MSFTVVSVFRFHGTFNISLLKTQIFPNRKQKFKKVNFSKLHPQANSKRGGIFMINYERENWKEKTRFYHFCHEHNEKFSDEY